MPVDFNIHYHVGKETEFRAKQAQVSSGQDTLRVAAREDYCWLPRQHHWCPADKERVGSSRVENRTEFDGCWRACRLWFTCHRTLARAAILAWRCLWAGCRQQQARRAFRTGRSTC